MAISHVSAPFPTRNSVTSRPARNRNSTDDTVVRRKAATIRYDYEFGGGCFLLLGSGDEMFPNFAIKVGGTRVTRCLRYPASDGNGWVSGGSSVCCSRALVIYEYFVAGRQMRLSFRVVGESRNIYCDEFSKPTFRRYYSGTLGWRHPQRISKTSHQRV